MAARNVVGHLDRSPRCRRPGAPRDDPHRIDEAGQGWGLPPIGIDGCGGDSELVRWGDVPPARREPRRDLAGEGGLQSMSFDQRVIAVYGPGYREVREKNCGTPLFTTRAARTPGTTSRSRPTMRLRTPSRSSKVGSAFG